jgi:hypothetical protein
MRFYWEEERYGQPCLSVTNVHGKSLRYPNLLLDRRLGGPQSGCDKNWAICVSTTKWTLILSFSTHSLVTLMTGHKYALQKMAKMACVYVGLWAFSYLLQVVCMHVCVHTHVFIVLCVCQNSSCMDVFSN